MELVRPHRCLLTTVGATRTTVATVVWIFRAPSLTRHCTIGVPRRSSRSISWPCAPRQNSCSSASLASTCSGTATGGAGLLLSNISRRVSNFFSFDHRQDKRLVIQKIFSTKRLTELRYSASTSSIIPPAALSRCRQPTRKRPDIVF